MFLNVPEEVFYSPQLIHHTNQHKESVLADALLEGVRTVAEPGVCAQWSRSKRKRCSNTCSSKLFHIHEASSDEARCVFRAFKITFGGSSNQF